MAFQKVIRIFTTDSLQLKLRWIISLSLANILQAYANEKYTGLQHFCWKISRENITLEDQSVDGKLILGECVTVWTGRNCLRTVPNAGVCKQCNETSVLINHTTS
jgi:hypothetical protein